MFQSVSAIAFRILKQCCLYKIKYINSIEKTQSPMKLPALVHWCLGGVMINAHKIMHELYDRKISPSHHGRSGPYHVSHDGAKSLRVVKQIIYSKRS